MSGTFAAVKLEPVEVSPEDAKKTEIDNFKKELPKQIRMMSAMDIGMKRIAARASACDTGYGEKLVADGRRSLSFSCFLMLFIVLGVFHFKISYMMLWGSSGKKLVRSSKLRSRRRRQCCRK